MTMNQTTNNHDIIDLRELFFSLIAQWKLIILCILLSIVFALLYLRVTPNTYLVDALILVEKPKGSTLGQEFTDIMGGDTGSTGSEIEILKSRLVLGSTIKKLNLDIEVSSPNNSFLDRLFSQSNFQVTYTPRGIHIETYADQFDIEEFLIPQKFLNRNLVFKAKDRNFLIVDPSTDKVLFEGKFNQNNILSSSDGLWKITIFSNTNSNEEFIIIKKSLLSAVGKILNDFEATEKGKQTGIISLNYQGNDKTYITNVLNTILQNYKEQNIERSSAEKEQTLKFLDKQLPELKKELDQAERQFNVFRQQYNTVDVSKESDLYLNQSITLETQKAQLQQKQAELAEKYTAEHPAMQEINAQLGVINNKISELNGTLKRLPDVQRQYLQLYRDVEVKTQLYTGLLNTYQTLNVAKAGEIGNIRIVDTAVEPIGPIKPKKLQILIIAIFLGAFIGIFLAALRNLVRTGIKDSSQIENELDFPVYATVPRSPIQESRIKLLKKKKNIPILAVKNSEDIAIESLRSMRTAIHFALANAKNNVIMIAGPAPEVGKSFISTNLAAILAQNNKRVLLIDADMRRGYLHKYFNAEIKPGLSEYLTDQATLEDIMHHSEVSGLDMITRGKSPANPSEILSSTQFQAMLEHLIPLYDHILIDTPPVLAVTDGIIISQYSGVNLIVARHAKTHMKELELTVNRFEQAGVKIDGFILNDIQASASYGYGYGYNYAYGYKASKDD